jgi:hypothetical protein
MALKSWLASLKADVSNVSGVSGQGGMVASDTGDTADTYRKTNADFQTTEAASTPNPPEPKRLFRQRGPWLTGAEQSAAQAYHAHHFNCHPCIAAGRGNRRGRRCAVGLALWNTYLEGLSQ